MRKIRDVLRYRYTTELSLEAIARALKISKGVVAKYLRLAESASIGWPLPEDCDDLALERLLYRQPEARSSSFIEPDYIEHPASSNDDHCPADMHNGQILVAKTVRALLNSKEFLLRK